MRATGAYLYCQDKYQKRNLFVVLNFLLIFHHYRPRLACFTAFQSPNYDAQKHGTILAPVEFTFVSRGDTHLDVVELRWPHEPLGRDQGNPGVHARRESREGFREHHREPRGQPRGEKRFQHSPAVERKTASEESVWAVGMDNAKSLKSQWGLI